MSRDEITAMAREAGFALAGTATVDALATLERFAALVAAKAAAEEREACAQVCERLSHRSRWVRAGINGVPIEMCPYAAAILARGKP